MLIRNLQKHKILIHSFKGFLPHVLPEQTFTLNDIGKFLGSFTEPSPDTQPMKEFFPQKPNESLAWSTNLQYFRMFPMPHGPKELYKVLGSHMSTYIK